MDNEENAATTTTETAYKQTPLYEPKEGEVLTCMFCGKEIKRDQVGLGFLNRELRRPYWIHETPCLGQCKNFQALYDRALALEAEPVQLGLFQEGEEAGGEQ